MTLSMHWNDVRHGGDAAKMNVGKTLVRLAKGALVAAGLIAVVVAIVAIRVYVFVPGLH